jgi:hypothetical protein
MSSKRVKTALAFLANFETLNSESFASLLTPTYTHIFRPSSQPPAQNYAQFTAHIKNLQTIIDRFPVWPNEVMEDESQNRVIVWCGGEAVFKDEFKDEGATVEEWTYKGEYMFVFSLDETREKIERVMEFLDSKAADHARDLMKRAAVNFQRKNKVGE